jgi:peroxiredoxin
MVSVDPTGENVVIADSDSLVAPKAYLGPNFPAIPIRAQGLDGSIIQLEDLRGQIVLLDFWATWCEPCRVELPMVKSVYEEFHDQGFEILGISLDEDEDVLRDFLKENDVTWPQVFDGLGWNNRVAQTYRVMAVPTTYLLDRQGIIRYRNPRGGELRNRVEELLTTQETP